MIGLEMMGILELSDLVQILFEHGSEGARNSKKFSSLVMVKVDKANGSSQAGFHLVMILKGQPRLYPVRIFMSVKLFCEPPNQ